MFDSSLITYAVSLHFTHDVNEIITSAVKAIAEVTGNNFIIENKIPPHVTIGAFHAAKENETKLIKKVEDFTKSQKAGIVRFTKIGNFNGKNLIPSLNAELCKNSPSSIAFRASGPSVITGF